MQSLKKAALLPLLLPLLAYVGAEYYLEHSLNRALAQVQLLLPDGSRFSYRELSADFDGQVALDGAELWLPGMSQPLQFRQLQFKAEDWGTLLDQAATIERGELPHSNQIRFSLQESSLKHLALPSLKPRQQLRGWLGCLAQPVANSPAVATTSTELAGQLEYLFEPDTHYLNLSLQLEGLQLYRVELEADLDIGHSRMDLQTLSTQSVGLGGAKLALVNLGAQNDLLAECGAMGRSGLIQGDYVARQSQLLRFSLEQQGWQVSHELEQAYQNYLFLPLEMRLEWQTRNAVPLQSLTQAQGWGSYTAQVGLNRYNSGSVDLRWGEPGSVTDSIPQPAEAAADGTPPLVAAKQVPLTGLLPALNPVNESPPDATPEGLVSASQSLQQSSYQPAYRRVSIPQLKSLLGSPLKLTTRNGRRIEGVLDSVGRNRLQLRREVAGGVAMVPVRLDSIEQLSAYF
ncbi:hypothetical protein DV711_18215 [Motiliproteus coralliicola]|uniref:Uncharacterized protein n=1 Tax=Motiliproteus coralliicola TaxID=2283196 RepID=A0A369W7S9_9GAMM|nr:hypothetical protein DV711_18215 [Motiliproteus coralliicola]